jgi:methyl-accepting chemotaxis protein
MKLGIKLLLGFTGIVLLSGLILGFTSLRNLNGVNQIITQIVEGEIPSIKTSTQVEQYFMQAQLAMTNYQLNLNDARVNEKDDKISAQVNLAETSRVLTELEKNTKNTEVLASIATIRSMTEQYQADMDTVVREIEKNHALSDTLEAKAAKVTELTAFYITDISAKTDEESLQSLPILVDVLNNSLNARLSMNKFILTKDSKHLNAMDKAIKKNQTHFKDLGNITVSAANQTMLKDVQAINDEFFTLSQEWIKNESALQPVLIRMNRTGADIRQNVLAAQDLVWQEVDNSKSNSSQILTIANYFTGGSIVLTLVIGIIMGLLFSRSITRPLRVVTEASRRIANDDLQSLADQMSAMAEGDLTRSMQISTEPLVISSRDEIGDLGRAFNAMILRLKETGQSFQLMNEHLNGVIGQVAGNANLLNSASSQLSTAAGQSGQAIGQIATTIQQIARGSAQESDSISRTATSVEAMGKAIGGIAAGAQEQSKAVAKAADLTNQISAAIQLVSENALVSSTDAANASAIAKKGAGTVAETIKGMQAIKEKVELSTVKVREMGSRSDKIGTIVETIDDIASQTNLLALNAAIEAARAGEHGKGFAVVADEVRKLAERSSSATKEIGALIKDIQKTVHEAVAAMGESSAEVENGVLHANQSDKALDEILSAIDAVNSQVEQIASAAEEISRSSNNLVSAMDEVSAVVEENTAATEEMTASSDEVSIAIENIASVSEENSASVEEVSASAEEMTAQVDEVTASAAGLADMARELKAIVSQFELSRADVVSLKVDLDDSFRTGLLEV